MKVCFKCNQEKNLSEFYAHKAMADGYLNKCKECTKNDVKKNYRTNINHYVEYDRERELKPERKASKAIIQKKHCDLNPQKRKARLAVGNAIRSGKIVKMNCEVCGSQNSQAHHHDYSKPLDIKWLCFVCHRAEHGQEARHAHLRPDYEPATVRQGS